MCAHISAFVAFLGFKVHTHPHNSLCFSFPEGRFKEEKNTFQNSRCKRLLKTINDTLGGCTDPQNFRLSSESDIAR